MGTKYVTNPAVGFGSNSPPDDGTQVAANLVTWAGVKTKLADPVHVQADGIDSKLVTALDLSARAISSPDTAIASDHWKTLQVTGTTTVTLSSAASMGAGYEVGVFNAGTGVVTVTPGAAADTINGVSASVTVSIKGTKIFRTNQALTGYNIVGGYDPQTVTATTSVVTPLVSSNAALRLASTIGSDVQTSPGGGTGWLFKDSSQHLFPNGDNDRDAGGPSNRIAHVFTPIIDTGTTGSGALKTNNGTTQITWDNNGAIAIGGRASPASGVGVAFPAAQSASTDVNTLDDYEEGTWTPSVGGSATYTIQTGTYTKIGRMVAIVGTISINTIGTGSTTVVSGLPFTSAANAAISVSSATALATNMVSVTAAVGAAGTTISFNGRTVASASESSSAIFGNGAGANFAGIYFV